MVVHLNSVQTVLSGHRSLCTAKVAHIGHTGLWLWKVLWKLFGLSMYDM